MKLRSIGSLVLLALAGCSDGSTGSDGPPGLPVIWANQQRLPTSSHLRGVRFNTGNQGFVVGEDTSLYRTNDGGITWDQQEHLPYQRGGDIRAIDFLGSELHAVGSDETGAGRFWTSPDADSWETPNLPGSGAKFVAVDVTPSPSGDPPNVNWYLREDWKVRMTVGTTTTDIVNLPPPVGMKATGIDMQYTGAGLVVGEGGNIWETTDAGATPWIQRTGAGVNHLRDVQIQAGGVAFACGDAGTLVWTETGGNLVQVPNGPGAGTFRAMQIFHLKLGDSTGWVVGNGGVIWKVRGIYNSAPPTPAWTWTWTAQNSNTTEDLYDVTFVNFDTGYAVGDNGMVVKTVDAGVTWTPLTTGTLDAFNAVCFEPGGLQGVAAGDNGRVYRTLDGGFTWTIFNGGLPVVNYTGVAIPSGGNRKTVYLCGEGGIVRRNLDFSGVGAWEAPAVAVPAVNYRAILFPSSDDVGFLVGDGSTLLYTNTGTSALAWSWANPTTSVPVVTDYRALCSGVTASGILLYAAGTNGVIVQANLAAYALPWTPVATPLGAATIRAIQAPPVDILFTAIDAPTSLFRRLAGITWQTASQPAPLPPPAAGLAFPTSSFGWWVSDRIYTTENGADPLTPDWRLSPTHTRSALRAIWMSSSGTIGYAVGEKGTILRTLSGGK